MHRRVVRLDPFSVRQSDADHAVVTYRADQTAACGTDVVPSPVWATSVYQKRDGRWFNVAYVQTPVPKP